MPRGWPLNCPRCKSPIDSGSGFGMVECAKCGELVMVSDLPLPAPQSPIVEPEPLTPFEQSLEAPLGAMPEAPFHVPTPKGSPLDAFLIQPGSKSDTGVSSVSARGALAPEAVTNNAATPMLPAEPLAENFHEPLAPPLPPPSGFTDMLKDHHGEAPHGEEPLRTEEKSDLGALGDLVDYANQAPSSPGFGGFGGLVYDVVIDGIDTSEMRQELSACLADPKLQLDAKEVLARVKGGTLTLTDLNPVRASVILTRLKHLSFRIIWKSRQMVKQSIITLALLISWAALGFFSASPQAVASDWARHEVNLKGYATKINSMQEEIQALVIKKNQNKDPEVRDDILKQIIKKNDDLQKLYKDYKDEQEHIRFEHPEQGDKTERKYRHVKLKTLDELENEVGLDGQLSRIKLKVEKTYPLPAKAEGDVKTDSSVKPEAGAKPE